MEILIQNIRPVGILSINVLASISYFIIYTSKRYKSSFFTLPVVVQKVYVAFFVLPLFTAPFTSQSEFADSNMALLLSGTVIAAFGLLMILFSFLKIGVIPSIKSGGGLSTTGVYSIVRHPIYFGTISTQLGLIIFNQALVCLVYLPVSIVLYYLMASLEEKDLIAGFGDEYLRFREKTRGKVLPRVL